MNGILKDKVVLVAGGAGLLGAEFCRSIARHGGAVWIADINHERAESLRADIAKAYQVETSCTVMDITCRAAIQSTLEAVHAEHGRLDAVVNAAYPRTSSWGKPFFEVGYEDFCENIRIQLGGAFLLAQQAAAYFSRQGYGNIIQIASIQGVIAPRFDTYEGTSMTTPVAYSVLKAGLIQLTRYMAKYLKGKNIRVNTISPGGILDNQPDNFLRKYKAYAANKGMLEPCDLSGTVVYLLSPAAEFVNGQNIIVDDGFTL